LPPPLWAGVAPLRLGVQGESPADLAADGGHAKADLWLILSIQATLPLTEWVEYPLKPLIGLAPVLRGTPVQSEFEADCDIDYTSSPT